MSGFLEAYRLFKATLRRDAEKYADKALTRGEWMRIWLFSPGFQFVLSYRVAELLRSVPAVGRLLRKMVWISSCKRFSSEIALGTPIGPGLFCPHPYGIVIGECEIGENVEILQGVTIGRLRREEATKPRIRAGARIGAGAKVLGPLEIGEGAMVGANAVVLQSVPAQHIAVGIPARLIPLREERVADDTRGASLYSLAEDGAAMGRVAGA